MVSLILFSFWLAAILFVLGGTWGFFKKKNQHPLHTDKSFPPVSILKPVKGIDSDLRENLESFFKLDYPLYELIFSVADKNDPDLTAIKGLLILYPQIPTRLVIGAKESGPNPKVNNLLIPYQLALNDHILVSDSNVRVSRSYLKEVVAHFGPDVGVVSGIIAGRSASGLGGKLEQIYLNTFYARWINLGSLLGIPLVIGKSMFFQRSVANRFGGLEALARYLAEDYMTGQAMKKLGLKVVVMSVPVQQHIGKYGIQEFWSRHVRWGRIRKSHAPLAFLIEPFMGPLMSGLMGAAAFSMLFGGSFTWFFLIHLAVWFICDGLLIGTLEPRDWVRLIPVWFLRELLALPHWFHMALGNTVMWRGNRYKLISGGLLE